MICVQNLRERFAHSIAARASSGIQAAGKGIPQLTPDGLTPGEHVTVAMMTCHPLQLTPTLFPPIAHAANDGFHSSQLYTKQRAHMLALLKPLADELEEDKHGAIAKCNPMVAKVLTQNGFVRHIPLQMGACFHFWRP